MSSSKKIYRERGVSWLMETPLLSFLPKLKVTIGIPIQIYIYIWICLLKLKWIWYVGGFLKMFLGPINVRASQKDVQLKVKEEYNSYRVCFTSLSFYLFLLFLICRILFCLFLLLQIHYSMFSFHPLLQHI